MQKSLGALALLLACSPATALAQLTIAVDEAPGPQAYVAGPEVIAAPAPTSAPLAPIPNEPPPRDDISGYSGLTLWLESMNLSQLNLTFGRPEIAILRGVELTPEWAGNAQLTARGIGGAGIAVGMRVHDFIRGPELRWMVGGGSVNGDWAAAPGLDGIDLSVRSAFVMRLEAAMGLEVPIGPVVPYLLGRAAVGGAWFDIAARDSRLGELGTETVDTAILELGIEAGLAFRLGGGAEIGMAFRGSFVGTESYGGMLTIGFDGGQADR